MRKLAFLFPLLLSWVALADGSPVLRAVDAEWANRDDPATLQLLNSQLDAEVKAHPQEFDVLWRAARLKQWMADGETHKEARMALGKEAWALGDRATQANGKAVQGYYYAALGIGAYSQGAGILKAIGEGLEGKYNDRLDTANRMDPNFQSAGGIVAKGRYYFELPWPKRSLNKSTEQLQKANVAHPENLRAYVYLAETQLRDGQAKKARETLEHAEQGAETYDPPEARRAKGMALPIKAEIAKELK